MTKEQIKVVIDEIDEIRRAAADGILSKTDVERAKNKAASVKPYLSDYGRTKLSAALNNLQSILSPKFCAAHGGRERVAQFVYEDLHRVRYELQEA